MPFSILFQILKSTLWCVSNRTVIYTKRSKKVAHKDLKIGNFKELDIKSIDDDIIYHLWEKIKIYKNNFEQFENTQTPIKVI